MKYVISSVNIGANKIDVCINGVVTLPDIPKELYFGVANETRLALLEYAHASEDEVRILEYTLDEKSL